MFVLDDAANICLSGGADGADLLWGHCAGKAGHKVIHFSFQGHKTQAPDAEVVRLSDEQLRVADPFLVTANATLRRRLPYTKPWIMNLLRRNYYQQINAQSLYAVSTLDKKGVGGGTAWAVQMFIDRQSGGECYLYDQQNGMWLRWAGEWLAIGAPPMPAGIWAGIGSRDLLPAGKGAIRSMWPNAA